MKIKQLLFQMLLCMFTLNIAAQHRLSGTVIDKKTKEPLIGATLYIKNIKKGTNTDEKGKYTLILPSGKYEIAVSSVGYTSAKRNVNINNRQTELNIELEESDNYLQEVVVKANAQRAEMNAIKKSPMSVSVIDGITLRGRAQNIEDILTRTSGIKIRKQGGLGSKSVISIHGLEGKRVAVFINGFALNSPDGSFDINDIPIDIIKYIEVYKGIIPAEYGGDGLGGAINIETREDDCDLAGFTQEFASFGTSKTLFSVKKVFDKPGIQLGFGGFYNRSHNDYKMQYPVYEVDLPEDVYRVVSRNNDFYGAGMLNVQAVFTKLWFDKIELEFAAYKNKKEIQSLEFDSRSALTKGTNYMTTLHMGKKDFLTSGLTLKSTLVIPFITTHLVDTTLQIRQWNGEYTHSKGETSDNLLNNSTDRQKEIRHQLNLKYELNSKNNINLNNQFVYSHYKPKDNYVADYLGFDPSGYPSKMRGNILGLTHEYFSTNKRLQNFLMFNLYYLNSEVYQITDGLKQDESGSPRQAPPKNGIDKLYYGFNEGISYEVMSGLRFKVSYAHAVRLPDTEELFGDGITTKPSVGLKPERSDNFNLGLVLDKRSFLGLSRLQIESNAYFMNINDMITLFPANTRLIYTNLGKTQIKGIDFDIKMDLTDNIYTYYNVTYQNVRDNLKWKTSDKTSENPTYRKRVPNIPWYYFNYGFEYHCEGLLGKSELSRIYIDGSYMHEFDWSWQMSNREDQKKKWKIPGSNLISIGLQQSFLNNKFSLGFQIDNIFDKDNYMEFKNPLPGRVFKIKLRFNWFRDESSGGAMGL